jgi:protein ImuA
MRLNTLHEPAPMSFHESPAVSRSQLVAELRERLGRLEAARRPAGEPNTSTGCEPLDRLLPGGGLSRGGLVEWLADDGSGAAWLALAAACAACREHGPLVVVDGSGTFYPPAAALADIELEELLVVHTEQDGDEAWALDQALRSTGVGAVFCQSQRLHPRAVRRLQLAAEASGGLGLLVRPEAARQEPCWAEARLLVRPLPAIEATLAGERRELTGRRLRVELLRARGVAGGKSVHLEIDDETGVVRLAAELAGAAFQSRWGERRSGA